VSVDSIKEYLVALSRFSSGKRESWRYSSYAELVLDLGQEWNYAPLPSTVERGVKKECFRNALLLAIDNSDLTYVEGWATSIIPLEHAWCVDYDGNVVDPTWDDEVDRAYFGVAIPTTVALSIVTKAGYYGVFGNDFRNDFDLLKNGLPDIAD
jgi:hypothetical protein